MKPEDRERRQKELATLKTGYQDIFKTTTGEHLVEWITKAENEAVSTARRSYDPQEAFRHLQHAKGLRDVREHIESMTKAS